MPFTVRRYRFNAFPDKQAFMAYYSPLAGMKVSAYLLLDDETEEYWDADNTGDLYDALQVACIDQGFTLTVEEVREPASGDSDPSFDSWEAEAQQ